MSHYRPDISIIIPVVNEQDTINKAVNHLYELKFNGSIEVIVVDGSSGSSTLECIENEKVIKVASKPGRGCQLNNGAKKAKGKTLLFLHCDTILPKNSLKQINEIVQGKNIQAGAFDLAINDKSIFFRVIEKSASFRSRITKIPYGDQAIFIKKEYFNKIGQFSEIPIMEDVDLMRRIKKDKTRIHILKNCALTSSRRWKKEGLVFCTIRNWFIICLYLAGIKPQRLARLYKANKN